MASANNRIAMSGSVSSTASAASTNVVSAWSRDPHRVSTAPRSSWMCARSGGIGPGRQRPVEQVHGPVR